MVSGTKNKERNLNPKDSVETLKELVLHSLEEDKAEDIITIDLTGKASFAHYIIIATGRSARHVISTADKLADRLVAEGYSNIGLEGKAQGDWVLVDVHDIIVHIFHPEARKLFELEKIWGFEIDN